MKNRKTRSAMRRMLFTLALVLVVAVASVGGTIAWLTATTAPVTNTFTVGDINIDLTETEGKQTDGSYKFKMVPGNTIAKDPKVTVEAGSEACWLFVKIEKSSNLDSFITYSVDEGVDKWTKLTGVTGVDNVYFREVPATTTSAAEFYVLTNNQVTVKDTVTKTMMNGLTDATRPTLTFTAYAVQKDNIADAAAAWAKLTPGT